MRADVHQSAAFACYLSVCLLACLSICSLLFFFFLSSRDIYSFPLPAASGSNSDLTLLQLENRLRGLEQHERREQ